MIRLAVCLGILFSAPAMLAQRPGAPSLNQAEQAEAKSQKDMPPPLSQRGPIDVVKLQRANPATVATSYAPASGLRDENPLDLASSPRNGV